MKKTLKAGVLLATGLFAMTGCSSSGDDAGTSPTQETTASAAPSGTSEPSAAADASASAVGAEQYTAEQIEAALAGAKESQGLGGQIIPGDMLRSQVEGAAGMLGDVVITPEKCDVLASMDVSKALDSANVGMMQLSATDLVSVVSRSEAAAAQYEAATTEQLMGECSEFQMDVAGQVITASTQPLDAATDAESTHAFRTTVNAAGQATDSIQVAGVYGTTTITVSMTNAADAGAAVDRAEALINVLLGELAEQ